MSTVTKNAQENLFLNFLKGLACMGVVFMHVTFPGIGGKVISLLAAYAVPLFFMIAGYYSYNKEETVISRRFKKILFIFIFGYLVFFLSSFALSFLKGESIVWLKENFNLFTPIKYIVFCTIDFAVPLWYLIAMAETYLFWRIIVKKEKTDLFSKWVVIALFILQIFLIVFCDTKGLAWFWKTNFITRALPWFLAGYMICASKENLEKKFSNSKLLLGAFIGCVIILLPTILKLKVDISSVGYIPLAISLFLLSTKYPETEVSKPIAYIGKNLSLFIYILHVPLSTFISIVLSKIIRMDVESNIYLISKPILTLVGTIILSYILFMLQNCYNKKAAK